MLSVLKKIIIQSLCQKLKNIYFTRMKFKQRNLQGEKSKMTYIIGGKNTINLKETSAKQHHKHFSHSSTMANNFFHQFGF